MDIGSLRVLAQDAIFGVLSVPATLTRPYPGETPITASIIWLTSVTEDALIGAELQRREARRTVAVRRTVAPSLPKGTLIVAADVPGGVERRWRVDGVERMEPDQGRYTVVLDVDPLTVEPEL